MNTKDKIQTGKLFHQLHHSGKILILPNIWDPLGAVLLERLGYPAAATSSSAIAISNGYADGENLPFDEQLKVFQRIVESVSIPVTADIETAYASNNFSLAENIKRLADTGIAGINYEDSRHGQKELLPVKDQCEKIEVIKNTLARAGSPLFINARIDVYIKAGHLNGDEKLQETLLRGKAYKNSGADGLYPILLKDSRHIETIVKETGLPVNITMVPGIPGFEILKDIGVARLSLASGFLKSAVYSMKNIAEKLLNYEGMDEATQNMVSSDYLNSLVPQKN